MRAEEHHIQDASEVYAVAVLQRTAEELGLATPGSSRTLYTDYEQYLAERLLDDRTVREGSYAQYLRSVDVHAPAFIRRLADLHPEGRYTFEDVEVASRNRNLKADFTFSTPGAHYAISLKNYRASMARPQVCSGTYNSFITNFLFESAGVGTWINPITNAKFRSRGSGARDQAIKSIGLEGILDDLHGLDRLNADIKARFVYGEEFAFIDEQEFDRARKLCGNQGADLALSILQKIPEDAIRNRVLRMTGMDGAEHIFFMDPVRSVDSITSHKFQELLQKMRSAHVRFERWGQSIRFTLFEGGQDLLTADVPFTINKNGAWMTDHSLAGRWHAKEGLILEYGQRRPKKSKELATSVNTYVNLERAGIFDEGIEVHG